MTQRLDVAKPYASRLLDSFVEDTVSFFLPAQSSERTAD